MDDIPVLAKYLIERYSNKAGKKIRNIRKETLELFQAYDWPGNIRELQNVIERAWCIRKSSPRMCTGYLAKEASIQSSRDSVAISTTELVRRNVAEP